jgi:hypothetical protein
MGAILAAFGVGIPGVFWLDSPQEERMLAFSHAGQHSALYTRWRLPRLDSREPTIYIYHAVMRILVLSKEQRRMRNLLGPTKPLQRDLLLQCRRIEIWKDVSLSLSFSLSLLTHSHRLIEEEPAKKNTYIKIKTNLLSCPSPRTQVQLHSHAHGDSRTRLPARA